MPPPHSDTQIKSNSRRNSPNMGRPEIVAAPSPPVVPPITVEECKVEKTAVPQQEVTPAATALISQIQLFGVVLVDNDQKRDRFLQLYISAVLAAVGFSSYTLVGKVDFTQPHIDLSLPIFKLITAFMFVVLVVGLATFQVLLRFRVLHTFYVKLLNKNRGLLVHAIHQSNPVIAEQMFLAWQGLLRDSSPKYLKTTGLEQSLMFFQALVNGVVFGICTFLVCASLSMHPFLESNSLLHLSGFISGTVFLTLAQLKWMHHVLAKEDKNHEENSVSLPGIAMVLNADSLTPPEGKNGNGSL